MRIKEELEDSGLDRKDFLDQYFKDTTNITIEELGEWELNICDNCGIIEDTYELIWITAEGFEPKPGEIVSEEVYNKYNALCLGCYTSIIKKGRL